MMPDPTDRSLLMHTLSGEPNAFGDLVRRYQQSVFNVCYRLLGERREAEDLTQEAFIRAYQRLCTFDQQREFGPWMRRLAANLCYNHMQKHHPEEAPLEEETALDMWPPPGGTLQPETTLLQAEQQAALRAALLELIPPQRLALELRHFQDLSYEEIATELHLPVNTVKSHLFRARKQLAQRLSEKSEI